MLKALLIATMLACASSYVLYKQCDARWKSQRLGTSSATICSAGCLMSSVAMVLSNHFNPSTLNTWLTHNGGYVQGDLFVWTSVARYGLHYEG